MARPCVVAGQHPSRLCLACRRMAGAGGRGRTPEVQTGAGHYLAEVQVQQRGFYLRPTPAYFCSVSRRWHTASTDGRRLCRRGPDLGAGWRAIAFTSARHEDRDYDNAADVWLIPAAGGELAPDGYRRSRELPVFAPDGRTIAFLGHRYRHDAGRNMRVFTVPVTGGMPTCLIPDLDRTCLPFLLV